MADRHYLETIARRPVPAVNGRPLGARYHRGDAVRDAEIAAIVARARHRADTAPGAHPRCRRCGLPAAECEETQCLTVCPRHGSLLVRFEVRQVLVCSSETHNRGSCGYEVAVR